VSQLIDKSSVKSPKAAANGLRDFHDPVAQGSGAPSPYEQVHLSGATRTLRRRADASGIEVVSTLDAPTTRLGAGTTFDTWSRPSRGPGQACERVGSRWSWVMVKRRMLAGDGTDHLPYLPARDTPLLARSLGPHGLRPNLNPTPRDGTRVADALASSGSSAERRDGRLPGWGSLGLPRLRVPWPGRRLAGTCGPVRAFRGPHRAPGHVLRGQVRFTGRGFDVPGGLLPLIPCWMLRCSCTPHASARAPTTVGTRRGFSTSSRVAGRSETASVRGAGRVHGEGGPGAGRMLNCW